jgi:hypothetical protein
LWLSAATAFVCLLQTWCRAGNCECMLSTFCVPDWCPYSAKYPLAVVAKLLDVFGGNLGGGYDIGCQFKTTLNSSTLGPLARSLNHTCLVGAFHGHAHRRLCQLVSLTTYIKGLGIEDLETCERTFSKSNSLASSLRYASVFHRQQSIDSYFEHNDNFEVYANLCKFI